MKIVKKLSKTKTSFQDIPVEVLAPYLTQYAKVWRNALLVNKAYKHELFEREDDMFVQQVFETLECLSPLSYSLGNVKLETYKCVRMIRLSELHYGHVQILDVYEELFAPNGTGMLTEAAYSRRCNDDDVLRILTVWFLALAETSPSFCNHKLLRVAIMYSVTGYMMWLYKNRRYCTSSVEVLLWRNSSNFVFPMTQESWREVLVVLPIGLRTRVLNWFHDFLLHTFANFDV